MTKLIINNSVCKIEGLDKPNFDRLRDFVVQKYVEFGQHRVPPAGNLVTSASGGTVYYIDLRGYKCSVTKVRGGYVRSLEEAKKLKLQGKLQFKGTGERKTKFVDRYGNFPTGLLYLVNRFIRVMKLEVETVDLRVRPTIPYLGLPTLFRYGMPFEPYPEQREAATALVRAGRGICAAVTALGKSMIAGLICDQVQAPTLIVVPTLALKLELTETLRAWFGEHIAGPLSYRRSWSTPDYLISVENVDALEAKPMPGIACVIIDEFHHSGAKTYRELNKKAWVDVYFKFGLTGTPFRANDAERMQLESILSKVVYRIPYRQALEKGRVAPLEVYYIDLPKQAMVGSSKNWRDVYRELVVEHDERNRLSAALLRRFRDLKQPALCLVKEIPHGREISRLSGCPFASGVDKNSTEMLRGFNDRTTLAVVGTSGVMGEGRDTKTAEWVILAGGGKSKIQFMQQIGRVLRKKPNGESGKVIMFRDASNKWLLDHFEICCQALRDEYGVEPVKLELEL